MSPMPAASSQLKALLLHNTPSELTVLQAVHSSCLYMSLHIILFRYSYIGGNSMSFRSDSEFSDHPPGHLTYIFLFSLMYALILLLFS